MDNEYIKTQTQQELIDLYFRLDEIMSDVGFAYKKLEELINVVEDRCKGEGIEII